MVRVICLVILLSIRQTIRKTRTYNNNQGKVSTIGTAIIVVTTAIITTKITTILLKLPLLILLLLTITLLSTETMLWCKVIDISDNNQSKAQW